jgi:putative heme-binding domain-containing protein
MHAKVSSLAGDASRGEQIFFRNCATCHRLHGQGHDVGPNLQSVAGRDRKSLLNDLLNPNAAVAPQFQVYVAKVPGLDLVSGIIAAETPASITLRRANAEETTIARKDLLEFRAWPASMMPEGLENSISVQEFADLLEFLGRGPVK